MNRREIITGRAIESAPDIVIEILSPSTKGQDVHLKRACYARFGIGEYWLVDPDRGSIEVLRLEEKGYEIWGRFDRTATLQSPSFPEISIPLAPVFRPH